MGKKARIRRNAAQAQVSIVSGDEAGSSFSALLERMRTNPENFMVGSDLPMYGTGYMCTGCAMPASKPGLSQCCGAPVIEVELD
jgi:hypothetical protein